MSKPLMNRRTQQPFRQYQASASWLAEEESEYRRFLAEMQPHNDSLRRTLLAWGLICVSLALALVAVIWFRP